MNKRTHSTYWCVIAIVMTFALGIMGCSDDEPEIEEEYSYVPDDPDMVLKKTFWVDLVDIDWIELEQFHDNDGKIYKTYSEYYYGDPWNIPDPDSVACIKNSCRNTRWILLSHTILFKILQYS